MPVPSPDSLWLTCGSIAEGSGCMTEAAEVPLVRYG
jgi:hypothetical protein